VKVTLEDVALFAGLAPSFAVAFQVQEPSVTPLNVTVQLLPEPLVMPKFWASPVPLRMLIETDLTMPLLSVTSAVNVTVPEGTVAPFAGVIVPKTGAVVSPAWATTS
jgi:hypothetical protein